MVYKAVVSDLDGTLLNSKGEVSEYTRNVIKKIREKGIQFFIATGRHHIDAGKVKEKLNLDSYLITSNGAIIQDPMGKMIIEHNLQSDIVKEILDEVRDIKDIQRNLYVRDNWYLDQSTEQIDKFAEETGFYYDLIDFDKIEDCSAIKLFFMSDNHETLVKLEKIILAKYSDKVNIMFASPISLEITPYGISKGQAIKEIFKKENIGLDDVIAFGDSFNDYEMLNVVKKGIVMGNAHHKVKEALNDHEMIGTNNEDAVAKYLEKLFLIDKK